jgi:hypothetical protein
VTIRDIPPVPSASWYAAELTALLASMPGITSTPAERAVWYEREADLLERAAADGASNAEQATDLARIARQRAAQWRRG